MRSSRCAFSTAAALHRVFIGPVERPLLSQLRPQLLPTTAPQLSVSRFQQRTYASALPRDDKILNLKFPYVHIVTDDGKLSEPQLVSDILATLDRQTHSLVTVALPRKWLRSGWERTQTATPAEDALEEGGAARAEPKIPICRIINKQVARVAEKAKSKKRANPALTLKTLELNWAIDPHDLEHRLRRMREFLEKGYRVDVLLIGKRKKRKATLEEAAETLRKIKESIGMVEGAREWKSMEGKVGVQVTLYIEGRPRKEEEE